MRFYVDAGALRAGLGERRRRLGGRDILRAQEGDELARQPARAAPDVERPLAPA